MSLLLSLLLLLPLTAAEASDVSLKLLLLLLLLLMSRLWLRLLLLLPFLRFVDAVVATFVAPEASAFVAPLELMLLVSHGVVRRCCC